ncbi:MAG: cation:proton antiporter [Ignavibacteriales bacterium]|nr:cation:proton antiporter [Ignavibacteriales bacterium]
MDKFSIIRDIALILAVSLPVLFLCRKIKISPIVGFLVTGIIIGPSGLHFIAQNEQIEVMSEVGIILLMFTIGLEFSIAKLVKMKKYLLLFGGLQVVISSVAGFFVIYFNGASAQVAIFLGMVASLSSTTIVLKLLSEKSAVDSPHGRISIGILIFQDLAVIPMLIILPLLKGGAGFSLGSFVLKIGLAGGLIAAMIALARFIVPKLLYYVSAMRMREVFTAMMVVLVFGTAYLAHMVGLSFSIGVFIAGFIIAESEYSYEILSEITPFRDIFNSIFFVSAGLLLSLTALQEHFMQIMILSFLVIVVKTGIVLAIVVFLGYPFRTGIIAGVSLAQIGEFGFVLAKSGTEAGIISNAGHNIFLSVAIISMIVTPFLFEFAPRLLHILRLKTDSDMDEMPEKPTVLENHVIIAGYGLNGRNLVKVLKETGIPYIILELNPDTVRQVKADGENILYGDITKRDILLRAGIIKAKVFVYAISDPQSTRMSLAMAKGLNPAVYTIVRTRYVTEIEELIKLKADSVIPEEFETSLQIFSKVLAEYHLPVNIVLRQINIIRQGGYHALDGYYCTECDGNIFHGKRQPRDWQVSQRARFARCHGCNNYFHRTERYADK